MNIYSDLKKLLPKCAYYALFVKNTITHQTFMYYRARKKLLTLDTMLNILVTLQQGGSMRDAMKHIPSRLVGRYLDKELAAEAEKGRFVFVQGEDYRPG